MRLQVRQEHYPSESDLGVGLIVWDIYSCQRHELTGPLMRLPRRSVERAAIALAEELGLMEPEARARKPYRFTVSVPAILRPLVQARMKEEHYRSASAYITGLLYFSLKVRDKKKVPHHKTSPLLREPEWVKDAAFVQIAQQFGEPGRKWPKPEK